MAERTLSKNSLLAEWLNRCLVRNRQPHGHARRILSFNGQVIGSVDPLLWPLVAPHWPPAKSLDKCLDSLAQALQASGRCGVWRNEFVAVRNAEGNGVGRIERGAARVLGVATEAVHLVGFAPDGRVWIQQRALDKANDPGLWDTLVGGMVANGETLHDTMVRETREEAGLPVHELQNLKWGTPFLMTRPTDDGGGLGQLVETVHWCVATVPAHLRPENLDGEVAGFECLDANAVARRVLDGACTDEAALVLARALGWPLSPA
ncbi:MAG TPA: NUDIX domain-containing protein [Hydrogenophaga sp.]|uniref:NUDIX hydrolase n=1 Tax=Hydrogenophaga sp. TaxID=1904254 RepID=UPI002BE46B8F|nr:NUDIX domain-containing protein [Hydrogenophaga sp.]HMN92664.1 NUDIX domain-containing protein [Hydrogenophaga sp.]HMP09247.1 NUDIX domain-containing protein [Hydrogenophaga sp.]